MNSHQQEIAELLRDLGKPAEMIAIQAQMPVDRVREWLGTGVWKLRQPSLFDAGALPPQKTTQPASTLGGNRGLCLFAVIRSANRVEPCTPEEERN